MKVSIRRMDGETGVSEMKELSYEEIIEKCKMAIDGIKRKDFYIDVLYDGSSVTRISKSRSEENFVMRPKLEGLVVRAYKAGVWREYGLQDLGELPQAVERLKKYTAPVRDPVELQKFESWKINKEIKGKLPPEDIPINEKAQAVENIFNELQQADVRVINPIVVYYDHISERIFLNNEGCTLRQKIPRTRIFIQPIVKEGNRVEFDYLSKSGEVGFELVNSITRDDIQQVVNDSIDLLKSEKAPSGTFPVILDPDMAGLIAHESFGHGLEADQILRGRSYLEKYLNKRVASELCVICDSPVVKENIGSYFFDDEGIRAKKTVLVENGIFKNVIHDRYTASAMKLPAHGNGRRESYANKLHVRMTNTFFEAGNWKLEEMLEGIKRGVMLIRGYFGMEDPLAGGMQVTSKKGYLIENGEQTKLLGTIALSGYVLDVLTSIDAVSEGLIRYHGGTCGKGHEDYVPVTTGGPYLRAQRAVVSPG
ncbi:MAG TPA: TldD/PmbA family protein [Candidatus Deferrimicrobium sp.]|nr:TldD/PmbA family protein [Candidatus Deferrimicrobium sp.]